ncbi:TPA: transposase [Bacillus cereus]|uniref:RNA-guided endonuclease TnpB family protein n=1 Tax=Bacillus TaxID=1386 RepID=UPI001C2F820F|nr:MULTISPECIES: RNA-guided endonuclease TnpB family protein [unclassified Bacillus (in: firmicutes)]MCQ6346283.1 RNA-guided endonuclease TnpB family protein [Bacillus cereus]MCP1179897.1 RNA-guided endonuclease TnpB family protein [Bacillus sp. 1663tsa1]MCP1282143.1 RNA-guided endonuclease TnpB family protein [Bacillus sp. S0635]MCU5750618.1 RNA-guided endonuclease TnpB family protein [Bacillus cereus]HDX9627259.1 transposase [Bacillus cereus]
MARKKAVKVLRKQKKRETMQRFTQKQNIGRACLTAKEFRLLQRMSHSSKALRNVGLYTIKQSYLNDNRVATVKEVDNAMQADMNYSGVQSNSVQAIRRALFTEVTSFFKALEQWKKHPEKFTGRPKFPNYSRSTEKRIIEIYQVPKVDENGYWIIPMNVAFRKKIGSIRIRMPKNLRNKKISYIEIVPKQKGRFFEVHYTYEMHVSQMKKQPMTTSNALGCDLGVDRLVSCMTNTGDAFLIDGKKLKSINQYFNKMICNLQQKNVENGLSKRIVTNKIAALWHKRERQIHGYIAQTVGMLFKKVKEFDIDTIVVGYNAGWKQKSHMGKKNNQTFVQIPFHKLMAAIENKCVKEGIRFLKQEESYTSKASFLDKDPVPVWAKDDKMQYHFSGKRITRGLYKSKAGICIHADINGALNTLKKSKVVELDDNLKVKTPILLEVQKRKAVASRIA